MLSTHYSNEWDKFLDILDFKDSSFYKLNRKILHKRPAYYPLSSPNGREYTVRAHAELFADICKHQFSFNNGPESPDVSATMQLIPEATLNNTDFTTPGTIELLINHLPNREAPGDDSITNSAINTHQKV